MSWMCFNCGCGDPDDDHGNPKNITNKTFQEAGDENQQTEEESKQNAVKLLNRELGEAA